MVVDDDREMVRLLQTLFELEGHDVVVTRSYQEIEATLRQSMPDLVLMDVRVQDGDTIPLVRQLRQDEALARIPIVMASGLDRRHECLDAGANIFVLKPFLPDDLLRMVAGLLETSPEAGSDTE